MELETDRRMEEERKTEIKVIFKNDCSIKGLMGLAHLKHSRVSFSFNMSIALTSQLFPPQMH